ncbi:hypothetical protein [Geodermatophilus maliterrae]|uniref:Uncharacterized protein n=1 Tax=Geodermatophilus maliterrae TaxID=3162531 RepID=A0ABV3XCS1_9ACTN
MDQLRDRYHVGHNPPGYLADSRPACFDEWWLAANYLHVLMQEYADADDEAAYVVIGDSPAPRELLLDGGYPRMRMHADAVLQDDPPREGVDYSAAVEDNSGRLIAFWLLRVLCLGEDDGTDLSTGGGH